MAVPMPLGAEQRGATRASASATGGENAHQDGEGPAGSEKAQENSVISNNRRHTFFQSRLEVTHKRVLTLHGKGS